MHGFLPNSCSVFLLLLSCCFPARLVGGFSGHATISRAVRTPVPSHRAVTAQMNILDEILEEAETELNGTIVELPVMFESGDVDSLESFNFDRWNIHRSNSRYGRLLLGIVLGSTTRRVLPVVSLVTIFSLFVDLYNRVAAMDQFLLPELLLPLTPFELTAPVLGLLLVFRTDTANSRFCQGSEVAWEVTSSVRSVIRRLFVFSSGDDCSDEEQLAAADLIAASCALHDWIMNRYLRRMTERDRVVKKEAHLEMLRLALGVSAEETSDQDLSSLFPLGSTLTPHIGVTAISYGGTKRLTSLTDQERIALDDCLAGVTSALAKCEKLLRTPIPLGYTRSAVRFLWMWLTLLPFALVRTFSEFAMDTWWADKPQPVLELAMLFIAFIFLSIEDIAVQIEEPFVVLPLELHQKWLMQDAEQTLRLQTWSNGMRAKQQTKKSHD